MQFVMAISNPLRGARKAGTVGKPFSGVQVSRNSLVMLFDFDSHSCFKRGYAGPLSIYLIIVVSYLDFAIKKKKSKFVINSYKLKHYNKLLINGKFLAVSFFVLFCGE